MNERTRRRAAAGGIFEVSSTLGVMVVLGTIINVMMLLIAGIWKDKTVQF